MVKTNKMTKTEKNDFIRATTINETATSKDNSQAILREKLKIALGENLFNDLKNSIDNIEKSVPTTKNHYGNYLNILSNIPKEKRENYATMLILLGANVFGIKDALELLK